MHLLALGLSHKTASVAVRERFALDAAGVVECSAALRAAPGVCEVVWLSTCNRTEAYLVGDDFNLARDAAIQTLATRGGWTAESLAPHLYCYVGPDDVAEHLFRVAAGLDSLAVGETQVLGQVKEAYRIACERRSVGKLLHALFHRALESAKRVHRETGVGRSATSVSAVAVESARRLLGDLTGRSVLLVGAGETAELVARHLKENFLAHVLVANRTPERAVALAARYGGEARALAELDDLLAEVDIVVSSTGSPDWILSRDALARAMRPRQGRPLLVVDIAVPRDVEPEAESVPGVTLCNIDDLEGLVAANLHRRLREARRAERILAGEADRFAAWVQTLDVLPVVRALRDRAEAVRRRELDKALARLGPLDERQQTAVEALAASLVNQILDGPTRRLKELAAGPGGAEAARALADLFDLPAPAGRGTAGRPAVAEPEVRPVADSQGLIS